MINGKQKVVLVTGASSGIGRALVGELVTRGYRVIGIARSLDNLEMLQAEIPHGQFSYYTGDVADKKRIQEISSEIKKEGIIPTFFYLNAGMVGLEAVEPTDSLDICTSGRMGKTNRQSPGIRKLTNIPLNRSCAERKKGSNTKDGT